MSESSYLKNMGTYPTYFSADSHNHHQNTEKVTQIFTDSVSFYAQLLEVVNQSSLTAIFN